MVGFSYQWLDELERATNLPPIARLVLPELLPLARKMLDNGGDSIGVVQRLQNRVYELEYLVDELEDNFERAVSQSHDDWKHAQHKKLMAARVPVASAA